MREIQASEAKTNLPRILTAVERGETVIITRHGRPIARIVPEVNNQKAEVSKALEDMKALGRRVGKITVAEILAARDEGRKY